MVKLTISLEVNPLKGVSSSGNILPSPIVFSQMVLLPFRWPLQVRILGPLQDPTSADVLKHLGRPLLLSDRVQRRGRDVCLVRVNVWGRWNMQWIDWGVTERDKLGGKWQGMNWVNIKRWIEYWALLKPVLTTFLDKGDRRSCLPYPHRLCYRALPKKNPAVISSIQL